MNVVDPAVRCRIDDLNARFASALDSHAYETLRDLLTADVHYVGVGGEFTDVEAVIATFSSRTGTRTTRHQPGAVLLEPGAGGEVIGRSSWVTFASNESPPSGIGLYMVADFHDRYTVDADGRWWIAERIIRPVFRDPDLAPLAPGTAPPTTGDR